MKIKVRYQDKDGNEKYKIYDDEPTARKAKKWLLDNGYENVDMAVVLPKRVNALLRRKTPSQRLRRCLMAQTSAPCRP